MLQYCDVDTCDYEFLYILLLERMLDNNINISHKTMPSYLEHKSFCDMKPYPVRKIVWWESERIGTYYLTQQNEIGLFLKREYRGKGFGRQVLSHIIEEHKGKRLLANINPRNSHSIKLFESRGFSQCQITMELDTALADIASKC